MIGELDTDTMDFDLAARRSRVSKGGRPGRVVKAEEYYDLISVLINRSSAANDELQEMLDAAPREIIFRRVEITLAAKRKYNKPTEAAERDLKKVLDQLKPHVELLQSWVTKNVLKEDWAQMKTAVRQRRHKRNEDKKQIAVSADVYKKLLAFKEEYGYKSWDAALANMASAAKKKKDEMMKRNARRGH